MSAETTTIKELLVGIGFKIDQKGLNDFGDSIKNAVMKVAALDIASMLAKGAVTALVVAVADKLDAIGDTAERIGTTADELMRLQYVATLSGSSAEAAAASMEGLSNIAGQAAQGIGRGAKIFQQLGLSAKDAAGKMKPTTQLMTEIGEKVKDLSKQEQVAVLSKLGISPTMIGALTNGMQQLGGEFDALYQAAGVDLNQAAAASGEFNDAVDRMSMSFEAARTAITLRFMPKIMQGIDSARKSLVQNMPKIINSIEPIINFIMKVADVFIELTKGFSVGAGVIVGWFNKLNNATDGWAGYILAAAAAWKFLNLAFLASPIGIVLGLVTAIGLLIDDFLVWQEGGDSLIDWGKWKPAFDSVMAALDMLKAAWNAVWEPVSKVVNAIAKFGQQFDMGAVASGPMLTPSPQAAAAVTGGAQNISQQTQITVQGSIDPQATAKAVAGSQSRVNADMARNMKGAAR